MTAVAAGRHVLLVAFLGDLFVAVLVGACQAALLGALGRLGWIARGIDACGVTATSRCRLFGLATCGGIIHWRAVGACLGLGPVSYTHLRAHETVLDLVCRLLLEKKNK